MQFALNTRKKNRARIPLNNEVEPQKNQLTTLFQALLTFSADTILVDKAPRSPPDSRLRLTAKPSSQRTRVLSLKFSVRQKTSYFLLPASCFLLLAGRLISVFNIPSIINISEDAGETEFPDVASRVEKI